MHMDKSRTEMSEMLSRASFFPFYICILRFCSRKILARVTLSSIARTVSPRASFTDPIVRNFRCKTLDLISIRMDEKRIHSAIY